MNHMCNDSLYGGCSITLEIYYLTQKRMAQSMRSKSTTIFMTIICSVIYLNHSSEIMAGDLYAILVADTDARLIGEDAKESAKWVEVALKGNVIQKHLKLIPLDGKKVTKNRIFDAISVIPKGKGHTVFFYYVGHGYYQNGSLLAPHLEGGNLIPLSSIIARIKRRKPKSIITINDSCSIQPAGKRSYAAPVMPPPNKNSPLANQLFFDHNDWIHINTSSPDEYALAHEASLRNGVEQIFTGTPFSFAFFESMGKRDNPRGWPTVASEVSVKVNESFQKTAPGGKLRLNNKIISQDSQTLRAMKNGQIFLGGGK